MKPEALIITLRDLLMPKEKTDNQPILVPIDFSPYSEAALLFACELAEAIRAPVVILHVVHDPGDAPGYYEVKGRKKQLKRLQDLAAEKFEEFFGKLLEEHPKLDALKRATRKLVVGLPVTRILELIEKTRPKMVVMGSAGRTGLSRFVLGSKAEQLVRLCPTPVTIVKNQGVEI
jgi:nucleotide-binding universal stress UspA family protein